MNLVIVESPAKAKTINKYLGNDFHVLASYGHIRSLPSKNGSVIPEEGFKMKYEMISKSSAHVKKIVDISAKAQQIYLATDQDREGESISWHIAEILKQKKITSKFHRITFNEITKNAIAKAINNPKEIDMNLVHAQQARQCLDYLFGFTISPLLWVKLKGCRSAGRVQSVALRLVCEQENEIDKFVKQEYWTIKFELANNAQEKFLGQLTHLESKLLKKFDIPNQEEVDKVKKILDNFTKLNVIDVKHTSRLQSPPKPLITSSLQQKAYTEFGFSVKKTMTIAQKLYEGIHVNGNLVGLITYMRTDSTAISKEAVSDIRKLIHHLYGEEYVAQDTIKYKSKVKNAQEAHEAIRPTDVTIIPDDELKKQMIDEQYKLYSLIWRYSVACQMASAKINNVNVVMRPEGNVFEVKSSGSCIVFDGFKKVLANSSDEDKKLLPQLNIGDEIDVKDIIPEQHFTNPPPRYSEASLVDKLESLGIGRPSTYANIVSVLQERGYVILEKKRFVPSDIGRFLTSFLMNFFSNYVEYNFTSGLENDLDKVSNGETKWDQVLENFWFDFYRNTQKVYGIDTLDIIGTLENQLSDYLFKENHERSICKLCKGKMKLRSGKYGFYLSCSNYPECTYKLKINENNQDHEIDQLVQPEEQQELCFYENDKPVFLKKGPYGFYLELRNNTKDKILKRVSVPKAIDPDSITEKDAIQLVRLPLLIGKDPNEQKDIILNNGKYGFYLLYDKKNYALRGMPCHKILYLTLEDAIDLLNQKRKK